MAGRHPVVSVVSQPDRQRGRGRRLSPSPVSQRALEAGLPLLRPQQVGASEVLEALAATRPDLGVVVAFGQFVPRSVRQLPALGYCINAHASLLPRWRGAAPIARAILAGDATTGVSIMRVEKAMDAGPVARQRAVAIGPRETTGKLSARLATLAAELLLEVIEEIAAGAVHWTEQDASRASAAPKLGREDARLDWNEPAEALERRVRAMAPRPGAFTTLDGEALGILSARVDPSPASAAPGVVQRPAAGPLRIATGDGWLVPTRLQRPGKKPLDIEDYLRGRPIPDGARLG